MNRFAPLALLLVPSFLFAQEAPNKLSPKEISDGVLLLFDGETTFAWKSGNYAKAKEPATFEVDKGALALSGGAAYHDMPFGIDCNLTFEYQLVLKGKESFAHIGVQTPGWETRLKLPTPPKDQWFPVRLQIIREETGTPPEKKWVVKALNLDLARTTQPSKQAELGPNPVEFFATSGATLLLRNVKLQPLNLTSIFNGKNLEGWKIFPDKKSKFTVEDGVINIKDGPGDLQTEGTYANFFLQFDCISNGKHLNSGVFFRCRPNEYQNGYEAQIRNQFTPEATQEYTVEEYDPQTRMLVNKNKVKSTAFDFGTGAIYRRIPARKEVSKDGEWFTMTVVASENHLATWVNGIQVTDWYDNRPISDNARTGCKLGAGHISLQGHDPTTDLSFRNFRIATMPAKE